MSTIPGSHKKTFVVKINGRDHFLCQDHLHSDLAPNSKVIGETGRVCEVCWREDQS